MKKLKTVIEDEEMDVALNKEEILVGEHSIKIIEETKLGILLELDGEEIMVDDVIDLPDEGLKRVEIDGYTIDVKVVDPINEALNVGAKGGGEIISPMSGTISSINVEVGQDVKDGQILMVISAMKMENQIISPIPGVVRDIKVNNNEQVPSGKLLLIVEPKE